MAREKSLWDWLSKSRFFFQDRLHLNRVENMVDSGTPDVQGCFDGQDFFIELKSCARPVDVRTGIKPDIRRSQVDWFKARSRARGAAYVLIRVGSQRNRTVYLLRGNSIFALYKGALTEPALNQLSIVPPGAKPHEIILALIKDLP